MKLGFQHWASAAAAADVLWVSLGAALTLLLAAALLFWIYREHREREATDHQAATADPQGTDERQGTDDDRQGTDERNATTHPNATPSSCSAEAEPPTVIPKERSD